MKYLAIILSMFFGLSSIACNVSGNSIPTQLQETAFMFSEGTEINYEGKPYIKRGTSFFHADSDDPWIKVPEIEYQLEQGKIRLKMDDQNINLLEAPSTVHVRPYGCDIRSILKAPGSSRGINTSCACVHLNSGEHLLYLTEHK